MWRDPLSVEQVAQFDARTFDMVGHRKGAFPVSPVWALIARRSRRRCIDFPCIGHLHLLSTVQYPLLTWQLSIAEGSVSE